MKEQADVTAAVESEAELIARLGSGGFERLRVLVPIAREARAAAHAAGVGMLDGPSSPPAGSSCAATCASRRSRASCTATAA